jgi:uncharacterized protein YbjT (DUF2867 family)
MTILIAGASGAVGVPTIRHLVKCGAHIRALSSNEKSAANLRSLGVAETVVGDLTRDDDVRRAVDGVASVMHIPPRFREDEAEIGVRVLEAAMDARVGHFVFCSVFHPQMRDLDHHRNKLVVEEAVIESGIPFTILQPAMFMQNLRVEWPVIRERGVYQRPYSPDRKMALIDTDDLGEAAARVLVEPGYRGATFELAGPDQLTTAEMAAVVAAESGRPVKAEYRSLEEWQEWAKARGWTPWSITTYVKMCRHYDLHGYPGGNPLVLSAILGRVPGDYRSFVRRFLTAQKPV